ncbi:MAG: M23 family metallopeptidase [Clostridiales bacterium]|nr:M23 family metallopeptidase [Clostridiales bacterium]
MSFANKVLKNDGIEASDFYDFDKQNDGIETTKFRNSAKQNDGVERSENAVRYENYDGVWTGGDNGGGLNSIMEKEGGNLKNLQKKRPLKPAAPKKEFIKWCAFDVPYDALDKAMNLDADSHKNGAGDLDWIELLTLLAVKYYGNFSSYKPKDLDKLASDIRDGKDLSALKNNKYYGYHNEVMRTVLGEYLGYYKLVRPDGTLSEERYGLKVFSPVAAGYGYSHYDDFGAGRNFGYKRRHLGHDLMGAVGTPVIAVEGGTVAEIGWNRFGGWRIGIRSFDKKRYYYYAHMRKGHPYAARFKKGDEVAAGDVIGYIGMTGYSGKEDTNNVKPPHLHFGLQLIFDESQANGASEIWVDVYALSRLLHKNRCETVFDRETKNHVRKYRHA